MTCPKGGSTLNILTNDEREVSLDGHDSEDFPNLILVDVLWDQGSEQAVGQSGAGADDGGDEDHGDTAAQAEAHHPSHEGEKAQDANQWVSGVKNTKIEIILK